MRTYYEVEIGMYSYGPALLPGWLPKGTRIGNYCSLGPGILVFRRNHPTGRVAQHPFFYNSALGLIPQDSIHEDRDHRLSVESDVWIGANAIITPRCTMIGLGAVVGAGAVVTKDVAPFAIVAGNPARQIGERFPTEIQQALVASRWWECPIDCLVPCLPLFLEEVTLENARRLHLHVSRPST
jgi:acetyltransferase-like isoleucine patch superfamily enzyme